jgi:hypothetical protein
MNSIASQSDNSMKTAKWQFRFLAIMLLAALAYAICQTFSQIKPTTILADDATQQDFDSFAKNITANDIQKRIDHEKLALRFNPLDLQPLKNLAALATLANQTSEAEKYIAILASRTLQDEGVLLATTSQFVRDKKYGEALKSLDVLARTTGFKPEYATAMSAIAATQNGLDELIHYFVEHPKWRSDLIAYMASDPKQITNTLYAMFVEFKKAGAPPTQFETRSFLLRLISEKNYDQAYFIWLDQLTENELRKVSGVFDGAFEFDFGNRFFDWSYDAIANVQVSLVPRESGNSDRALVIDFNSGRTPFAHFSQLLKLSPADYVLSGESKAENLENERGLVWKIYCLPAASTPLATTEALRGIQQWAAFNSKFTVPAQDCGTQLLRLELNARAIADTQISGRVYYDNLKIERSDETKNNP